jgi:hypothetical protein
MLCDCDRLRTAGASAMNGRLTFASLTPTTGGAWLMSTLITICRPCEPT